MQVISKCWSVETESNNGAIYKENSPTSEVQEMLNK
jgi:hypothetical protein